MIKYLVSTMKKYLVICCRSEHIVTDQGCGEWSVEKTKDYSNGAYLEAVNGYKIVNDVRIVKANSPEEAMLAGGMPKGNIEEITLLDDPEENTD